MIQINFHFFDYMQFTIDYSLGGNPDPAVGEERELRSSRSKTGTFMYRSKWGKTHDD
jgi:hypothetical protein